VLVGEEVVAFSRSTNHLQEGAGKMDALKPNGNIEEAPHPEGRTLGELIEIYQTDRTSTFHKLRYHVRENQRSNLRRLAASHGHIELAAVKHRTIAEWHLDWTKDGHLAQAHRFIATIRTMCGFGASMLEDEQCERICMVLHRMKFAHPIPSTVFMTSDQANVIRDVARSHFGWPSMSLAQALQFELILRQKDVIGEWVPEIEPGETDVRHDGEKWLRGLRWEEIDHNLILRHMTSKRQKVLEVDLKLAEMVVEEFQLIVGEQPLIIVNDITKKETINRHLLPAAGPIVICDTNGLPWTGNEFRRKWRKVANKAGIPKEVKSMHSRHGGVTEADLAGADINHIKEAATHSDIAQTQRYSRANNEKIVGVQKLRALHRNKFRHNS
jgi:hypothetical protein